MRMMQPEITDEEARQQVLRTNAFIAEFRQLVEATIVDPSSACAAEARSGLERIAATLDAVDYIFYANLANINTAMRGGLLSLIEVKLMCVGAGPTLDFVDATAFLAEFNKLIDVVRKRYLH